jgi:hypothetical protein
MSRIKIVSLPTSGDLPLAVAIVHATIALEMEPEGEARQSRIRLPYWDVHKFRNDGSESDNIPKMHWEMLQGLGYEKQPKYFGTQVTYEGSEPMSSLQSPSEEFLRWKISVRPLLQDALSMLGFVMLPVKFTWSLVRAIASSWMDGVCPFSSTS